MSTQEYNYESLSLKPHMKLVPEKEWRINISTSEILNNPYVRRFIDANSVSSILVSKNVAIPRKYTEKELNRILADCHAEKKAKQDSKKEDFNQIINAEWAKVVVPPVKIPDEKTTARRRDDQLMQMGVPYINKTYYRRDFTDFYNDVINSISSLNDTTGDPLGEYTAMSFKPVAIYTDYVGRLFNTTDSIMMIPGDVTIDWITKLLFHCRFGVNNPKDCFRSEANHISIICENSVETYANYNQLSHKSPIEKDKSYIRFTLLLGGLKSHE